MHHVKWAGRIRQPCLELRLNLTLDDLLDQADNDDRFFASLLVEDHGKSALVYNDESVRSVLVGRQYLDGIGDDCLDYSLAMDFATSGWTSIGIVDSSMIVAPSFGYPTTLIIPVIRFVIWLSLFC